METNIELRQLRYFVIVAEELNFTRAAERLKIAQPPLSRQIQNLENNLQVELLARTNRRVTLTPAGEAFLAECRQILSHVEQSIRMTQRLAQGEIGKLAIGFEGSFHNETVLSIIQSFRNQFPDVDLILQEMPSGRQIDALEQRLIDIGFVDPIIYPKRISLIKLLTEPLVAVLSTAHPLATQDSVELTQLEQEPWIAGRIGEGCGLLTRLLEACRQVGFTPNIRQETNDIQMTLGFVASGLGVTLLPVSAPISEHRGIIYRKINPPIPWVELAVAWQDQNSSPVLKSFLSLVQSHYRTLQCEEPL